MMTLVMKEMDREVSCGPSKFLWYYICMKLCPKCTETKNKDEFYLNVRTSDGLAYACKKCIATYSKKYRVANRERIAENKQKWYEANKEDVLTYQALYYEQNKDRVVKRVVNYRRKRLKEDPIFKLQKNLRHRLGKLLKQQSSRTAIDFLGCPLEDFKTYLESKFEPGMTWENYGPKGWHIDHVLPLSAFDLTNPEELKSACRFTNLQPLWWQNNLSKSNKVE